MKKEDMLIRSRAIFTADKRFPELIDGYILIKDKKIAQVEEGPVPQELLNSGLKLEDAGDNLVLPGYIDPHTHLVHGGSREQELAMKLAGKSYMEIHEIGGIRSTMRATRGMSAAELYAKAKKSLDRMLAFGVTTVEAKSGYGLDKETEIRCLEVAGQLNQDHPADLVSSYMGAHALPAEFSAVNDYVEFMLTEVMPEIRERGLAEFCDIFCEQGIFDLEISRYYLQKAKEMGFLLKIHADEIVPLGGAELAAEMGAISAEHLMAISDEGIEKMAEAGTIAILLPATTFFLMAKSYAPAKKMKAAGVRIALATDYNPGSSPTENIQVSMAHACFGMGLAPEDIILAVTINAAAAVNREDIVGSITAGKKADILITDVKSPAELIYRFGVNHIEKVYKEGQLVAEKERICYE